VIKDRFIGIAAGIAISALVWGLAFLLPLILFHRPLGDWLPSTSYDDTVHYAAEIYSFRDWGWKGGYFGINEDPAPWSFSHFGFHGPFYAFVQGSMVRFVRVFLPSLFQSQSDLSLLNLIWVTLGIAFFLWLVRPRGRALRRFSLLVIFYWPLHVLIPTWSQESFHMALALVFAALFHRILVGRSSWKMFAATFVLLIVASSVRISWALLFVPFFLLWPKELSWKKGVLSLVCALFMIQALANVCNYTIAPLKYFEDNFRFLKMLSLEADFVRTFQRLMGSVFEFFNIKKLFSIRSEILLSLFRFQIVAWLLVSTILLVRSFRVGKGVGDPDIRESLFHCLNLGIVLVAVLVGYYIYQYPVYRVLSPHLLLSAAVGLVSLELSSWAQKNFVRLTLGAHILLLPCFLDFYFYQWSAYFRDTVPDPILFQKEVASKASFQPQENAWCNTVYYIDMRNPRLVLLFAPGLGIHNSFPEGSLPAHSLRSKYVYIDESLEGVKSVGQGKFQYVKGDRSVNLRLLGELGKSHLYENLDVSCL
jgi:hypothetical protein